MKLRNKETGEIIILIDHIFDNYKTLAELNAEWEDYEEPKELKESKKYWFVNSDGETLSYYEEEEEPEDTEACKEIGNYFETREEAEKAVEKLKAWKRLKDKGFKFCCDIEYESLCGNGFNIPLNAIMPPEAYTDTEVSKDLDLLFGGKE